VWFVLLSIALVLLGASGIYFRRRVLLACSNVGLSERSQRVIGYAILWLLFGMPALTFLTIASSLVLGVEIPVLPTGLGDWLLVYPFWMTVLVVFQAVPYFLLFDAAVFLARKRSERPRLHRYRSIASAIVIGFFVIYTPLRILVERQSLDVHRFEVGKRGGETKLRLAFFADLQVDDHTDSARAMEVVDHIGREAPDLILVGGDWVNRGAEHIELAGRVAARLESRHGAYSVRGDHEHFSYRDQERSVREITETLAAASETPLASFHSKSLAPVLRLSAPPVRSGWLHPTS